MASGSDRSCRQPFRLEAVTINWGRDHRRRHEPAQIESAKAHRFCQDIPESCAERTRHNKAKQESVKCD